MDAQTIEGRGRQTGARRLTQRPGGNKILGSMATTFLEKDMNTGGGGTSTAGSKPRAKGGSKILEATTCSIRAFKTYHKSFLIFANILKGVTGGERFISQLWENIRRKTRFWERFPENWGASLGLH